MLTCGNKVQISLCLFVGLFTVISTNGWKHFIGIHLKLEPGEKFFCRKTFLSKPKKMSKNNWHKKCLLRKFFAPKIILQKQFTGEKFTEKRYFNRKKICQKIFLTKSFFANFSCEISQLFSF